MHVDWRHKQQSISHKAKNIRDISLKINIRATSKKYLHKHMEQYNKTYLLQTTSYYIGFVSNLPYSPADAALVAFPFYSHFHSHTTSIFSFSSDLLQAWHLTQ